MSTIITENGDRQCASKNCNNQAQHYLRVLFLNKLGFFCNSCKIRLIEDNLVEELVEENKQLKATGLCSEPAKPADTECKRQSTRGSIYHVNR